MNQDNPIYYDGRVYYLVPDSSVAREPYAVFQKALENDGRYGVGQVVFSGKEQLALVRSFQSTLLMVMLNYAAEIQAPRNVVKPVALPKSAARQVQMAEQLLKHWSNDDFDFADYTDRFNKRVKGLIDAKVKGRDIVIPEQEDEPSVINLMDALRKSLDQRSSPGKKPPRRAGGKKSPKAIRKKRAS